MKRSIAMLFLFTLIAFSGGNASAESVYFGDDAIMWPNAPSFTARFDDTNGIPDLLGGSFNFTGHTLTSISLDYYLNEKNYTSATWNSVHPGDWFFDFNEDDVWDVVLHNQGRAGYALYSGAWEYGSNGYSWDDYVFASEAGSRKGHPTYAKTDAAVLIGDADFDGWRSFSEVKLYNPLDFPIVSSVWTLALDLNDYSGQTFRYGYTLSCANDVLFGEATVPTPEPSALVLVGLGLAGLLGLRKRMRA